MGSSFSDGGRILDPARAAGEWSRGPIVNLEQLYYYSCSCQDPWSNNQLLITNCREEVIGDWLLGTRDQADVSIAAPVSQPAADDPKPSTAAPRPKLPEGLPCARSNRCARRGPRRATCSLARNLPRPRSQ